MTDGTTTWSYTYDANGMRTQRSNGTKTYNYVYNGSQLTQMTVGNDTLYFTYGVLGPATVTWNGTTYYYALNAQGDVVGIYDNTGYVVVTYNWDNAWGDNPAPQGSLASTLGTLNPLRYRGYVYDTETGYYYLQSRYYDPEIGRFINADAFTSTGQGLLGNNMFAYCGNAPVNFADPSGTRYEYVRILGGGSQYVPVAGSSDGRMDSDGLLQYLKEHGAGNTGNTYYYTVQYVGVYEKTTDYTGEYVGYAISGVMLAVSFIPVVREIAWASAASQAFSVIDFCATGVSLYHKNSSSFPDKDYHQYRVTLHYYEDTQYNGRTYRTIYDYELYYLWNDARYNSSFWQLQQGIGNRTSYYID